MTADLTRRALIAGAGLGALGAVTGCADKDFPGTLDGADWQRGHGLRDHAFPPPGGPVEEIDLVIAGGGVAGLAAGWQARRSGFSRFALFELEDSVGGNARSGRNAISAYPLGAHYLPVPNVEAVDLLAMLREFGMVVGDVDGRPLYDPWQLCADLEERLLWRGQWQEGLVPQVGLSGAERAQFSRFAKTMAMFRAARGADGRPAFTLPMAFSSADPQFTDLDGQNFAHWLGGQGFTAAPLRAHIRYCCRDDYGSEPEAISAWAGLHYFAARRGWAAGQDGDRELTWPGGNGHLTALMAQSLAPQIRAGHSVFHVERDGEGVRLAVFDHARRQSRTIRARAAILAMPHFVAQRVAPDFVAQSGLSYAPWVVANVSVSRHPRGKGIALAWDNVSAASESLGYVVATHQSQSAPDGPTVLTWYLPLSRETPRQAREILMTRTLATWQRLVADDLLTMNPDLAGAITRIDVWRWGHAMIRPTPGFLRDPARTAAQALTPPVFLAHSDLSGLSLFEEAHWRGVEAMRAALRHIGST